jgi:hypothetical protein
MFLNQPYVSGVAPLIPSTEFIKDLMGECYLSDVSGAISLSKEDTFYNFNERIFIS